MDTALVDVPSSWPRVSSSRPNRSSAPVEDRSAGPATCLTYLTYLKKSKSNVRAMRADSNGADSVFIVWKAPVALRIFRDQLSDFHDSIIFHHIPSYSIIFHLVCGGRVLLRSVLDEAPQDSAASAPAKIATAHHRNPHSTWMSR